MKLIVFSLALLASVFQLGHCSLSFGASVASAPEFDIRDEAEFR